jgi:group II intron reverse transcriptase/maturase
MPMADTQADDVPWLYGESSLAGIRRLATSDPDLVFTSLAHRIDFHPLWKSFGEIRKSNVAGVDGMTAAEYARNLDQNLYKLLQRLRRGQYVATPVKRIWIDRENGKKRPIGIPGLEDKIVQKAVSTILEAIHEVDFYDFSHGFRRGHSQHRALQELREQCYGQNVNWIVNADISGLFDNIDHGLLKEAVRLRANDGGILRLIGKWLNAGVMEEGILSCPGTGTPQGGVISPVLSNIFLHYVLDDWFVREVQPRLKGRSFIIRYADDFIIGCQMGQDAEMMMELLSERFGRFSLSLNKEKSKLVLFSRPPMKNGKGWGTFDFLGFTFYWGKSRKGRWVIKKKTVRKRLARFVKSIWGWCRENRHERIKDQHERLCQKLRGYYQYFGVRANYESLYKVYQRSMGAWRYWLSRRSHKGGIVWEKFGEILKKYPLPRPRIVHNI